MKVRERNVFAVWSHRLQGGVITGLLRLKAHLAYHDDGILLAVICVVRSIDIAARDSRSWICTSARIVIIVTVCLPPSPDSGMSVFCSKMKGPASAMRWIEFLVEVIVAEMDGKPDIQRSAELLSRTRYGHPSGRLVSARD